MMSGKIADMKEIQVEPEALSKVERRGVRRSLFLDRLREYLRFDSFLYRKMCGIGGALVAIILLACGRKKKGLSILATLHRSNFAALSNWIAATVFRKTETRHATKSSARFVFESHIAQARERLRREAGAAPFVENTHRLLGSRVLVLKSPKANEKGVIVIDYSWLFPLLANLYDVTQMAQRYHLVLEPSWSGYCDLDILCYSLFDFPVFVQSCEPRDSLFLQKSSTNFLPVAIGANWWVDHRIMRPLPEVQKDVDVIKIASWNRFKRHGPFFAALARLRRKGERLRVVLIGYSGDYHLDDIYRQARYYGIGDQVEMYERISPEEVNRHLNRAKVNVVWSRKEGVNRTSVEGLFAGVPCVMREGFNYGYHYPHINPATGCYSSERALPEKLLWMTRNYQTFAAREWVMANMTCQKATEILSDSIRRVAVANGEEWTQGLAAKTSFLSTMSYWDDEDKKQFAGDYDYLRSLLREPGIPRAFPAFA